MSSHYRREFRRRSILVACALATTVYCGLPGNALAQDGFTSPLIIPAAEFENSGVDNLGRNDRFSNSYGYVSTVSTTQQTTLMAGVYLPAGVTITRFEAAVADLIVENPSSTSTCARFYPDVEVELLSTHYDDNIYAQDTHVITHASVTSELDTGFTHIVADTTIDTPYVNNIQQMFWVRVSVCSQFQTFQGVRIHYEE